MGKVPYVTTVSDCCCMSLGNVAVNDGKSPFLFYSIG
jgi:hypothetical protein